MMQNPSIFSDCLTTRFGFQNDLNRFIDQIPETVKLFTANLARNLDESRNNFVGVYNGNGSSDDKTKQEFESSDFILTLGFFPNEMNTGGHTSNFSMIKDVVIVHADYIKVNHQIYHIKQNDGERLFTLGEFLCTLTEKFDPSKLSVAAAEPKRFTNINLRNNTVHQILIIFHRANSLTISTPLLNPMICLF